jgi:hypothetical protein
MIRSLRLHPDRLFPMEAGVRDIARRLYAAVEKLPIISPHGHADPAWFAGNAPFGNATELLLTPDHYLFRGTPSRLWLNWVASAVFGIEQQLCAATADDYCDRITAALQTPAFWPGALFERFNIELLAYLGMWRGHTYVHEAIADAGLCGLVEQLMLAEAAPTLPAMPGFDANHYARDLLQRFANTAPPHRLAQIAMDGSQKIPRHWLETLAANAAQGRDCPALLQALAGWMRFVRGDRFRVDDPAAARALVEVARVRRLNSCAGAAAALQ